MLYLFADSWVRWIHLSILSLPLVPSWHDLDCWKYPDGHSSNSLTFDYLVRGFIPTQLTNHLSLLIRKKDALKALGDTMSQAIVHFKDKIWSFRCEHFTRTATALGITHSDKTGSVRSSHPNVLATRSGNTQSRSTPSNRWKTWIMQSLTAGTNWMDFRIHINISI